MAWDTQTDPEFQEKLDWMKAFIDEELISLETILDRVSGDEWASVKRNLQGRVKEQGRSMVSMAGCCLE